MQSSLTSKNSKVSDSSSTGTKNSPPHGVPSGVSQEQLVFFDVQGGAAKKALMSFTKQSTGSNYQEGQLNQSDMAEEEEEQCLSETKRYRQSNVPLPSQEKELEFGPTHLQSFTMDTIVTGLAKLEIATRWKDPNFSQAYSSPYYPAHWLEKANRYDAKAGTTVGAFIANPVIFLPVQSKRPTPEPAPKWMQAPVKDPTGKPKRGPDGELVYRKINEDAQAPEYARRAQENYNAALAALQRIPGYEEYYWDCLPYIAFEFQRGQKKQSYQGYGQV